MSNNKIGTVELILGCMYSGKTEELIRRLKRQKIAKKNVIAFKPRLDNRYSEDKISTHTGEMIDCIVIDNALEILKYINNNTQVVGIEEIQFFNEELLEIIEALRDDGIKVICCGLDMDSNGIAFENSKEVAGICDKIDKLQAVCVKCGEAATMSYKLKDDGKRISVGSDGMYEARCRDCWEE